MEKALVSIIMPVYGVEKYLDYSINSVLNQTYTNFELILVDDKSPDKCPEICDKYAAQDNRIKVIHKEQNEGLGFARNTGYSAVNGKYVCFIDSDDYMEPNLLEKAFNALDENTEIVVFGINRVFENKNGSIKKIEKLIPEQKESTSSRETADIFAMLNRCKVFPFAWNKLYKKSFIDSCQIQFEKTKLIEDFLYNIDLFSKATYIKVIPDTLSNYRKPAHETLVSAYSPDFFDLCKRKYTLEREYLRTVNAETDEYLQLLYSSYVKHLMSVFLKNKSKKANLSKAQQKQQIKLVLSDPMTEQVLSDFIPCGLPMKIVTSIFKSKNTLIISTLVSTAHFIINR